MKISPFLLTVLVHILCFSESNSQMNRPKSPEVVYKLQGNSDGGFDTIARWTIHAL